MPSRIYESPYPSTAVSTNDSFWQFILRMDIDDTPPDKVILQEHERPEKYLTFGSAPTAAASGASGLSRVLGLTKGDMIIIIGKNSLDWLRLEFAALWGGMTAALVNPIATSCELAHYISVVNPVAVFCDPGEVMERLVNALDMSSTDKPRPTIVGLGEAGAATLTFPRDFSTDQSPSHASPLDLSSDDNRTCPAIICFSSGTSGLPKAAVLSHHNLIAYLLGARSTSPITANSDQNEVFYAPLSHIYGAHVTSLPLLTGGYVRLMRDYSLHEYIRACVSIRATTLRMVPPTVVAMVKDAFVRQQDLSCVRTIVCAGATLAPDIITEVRNMMGEVELIQGYGMTEGGISFLPRSSARRKQGSVGRLMANVEVRIVDDDLHDVAEGTPGEVLFKSPTVFMGYHNNDEANAEAFPFKDVWMRTGDVARMDSDGFLWLTDRKKDLIKYKGNQVAPAELESVLLSHPRVTEAGVCATWDQQEETEVPVGYVNFKPTVAGEARDGLLREVLEYVNERVSRPKRLRGGLFYLDVFPRNATGKLVRRNLPARLEMSRKAKM